MLILYGMFRVQGYSLTLALLGGFIEPELIAIIVPLSSFVVAIISVVVVAI